MILTVRSPEVSGRRHYSQEIPRKEGWPAFVVVAGWFDWQGNVLHFSTSPPPVELGRLTEEEEKLWTAIVCGEFDALRTA
jgi:hypothetical protein